eukprot:55003-Eustigmatos_ZCMA.PRE.1
MLYLACTQELFMPQHDDVEEGRIDVVIQPHRMTALSYGGRIPQSWDAIKAIIRKYETAKRRVLHAVEVSPDSHTRFAFPILSCAYQGQQGCDISLNAAR